MAEPARLLGATALGFRRHSLSPADGEKSTRRVPVAGAATGCTAATAEGRNANRHAAAERVVAADSAAARLAARVAEGKGEPTDGERHCRAHRNRRRDSDGAPRRRSGGAQRKPHTAAEHAAVVDHAAARLGSARLGRRRARPTTARGTVGPNRYEPAPGQRRGPRGAPPPRRRSAAQAATPPPSTGEEASASHRLREGGLSGPTDERQDSNGAYRRHGGGAQRKPPRRRRRARTGTRSRRGPAGSARRRRGEASAPRRRRVALSGPPKQAPGQRQGAPPQRRRSATRAATPLLIASWQPQAPRLGWQRASPKEEASALHRRRERHCRAQDSDGAHRRHGGRAQRRAATPPPSTPRRRAAPRLGRQRASPRGEGERAPPTAGGTIRP